MQFGKNNHLVWQKHKIFTCYSVFLCVLLCIIAYGISNELFLMTIPYDGKGNGEYLGHGIPKIDGGFSIFADASGHAAGFRWPTGPFTVASQSSVMQPTYYNYVFGAYTYIGFDSTRIIPGTDSVQPGSISAWAYISY